MAGGATYSIRRISRKGPDGITEPRFATVNAVLKFDSQNVPQCVYNEAVATRLAQTLHTPNAHGVLAAMPGSHAFASLKIADPGINLPNIPMSWIKKVATTYPDHVAALVAFDIFIGNTDRYQNIKASLFTPHMEVFAAFDHSHTLLHPFLDPVSAITRLASPEIITDKHTFYGYVERPRLDTWCRRIASTPDYLIRECCELGRPLNTVDVNTQRSLGNALIGRAKALPSIVASRNHIIRSKP